MGERHAREGPRLPPWNRRLPKRAAARSHFRIPRLAASIAKSGDEISLIPTAGDQRIVTKQLGHPHPRVRAQAVDTVLKLLPTATFAGSSQLVEALRGFITLELARLSSSSIQARSSPPNRDVPPPSRMGSGALLNEQDLTARIANLPDVQIVLVSEETTNVKSSCSDSVVNHVWRSRRSESWPTSTISPVRLSWPNSMAASKSPNLGGFGVNAETMLPAGLQNRIENPNKPKDWFNLDKMTRVVPYALQRRSLGPHHPSTLKAQCGCPTNARRSIKPRRPISTVDGVHLRESKLGENL